MIDPVINPAKHKHIEISESNGRFHLLVLISCASGKLWSVFGFITISLIPLLVGSNINKIGMQMNSIPASNDLCLLLITFANNLDPNQARQSLFHYIKMQKKICTSSCHDKLKVYLKK